MQPFLKLLVAVLVVLVSAALPAQNLRQSLDFQRQGDHASALRLLDYQIRAGWQSAPAVRALLYLPDGTPRTEAQQRRHLDQLRQDAGRGKPEAAYALGLFYRFGVGVVEADGKKAFEWLSDAAAKGSDAARVNLFELYTEGTLVARDEALALSFLKKAAERYGSAQNTLGTLYLNGRFVENSPALALEWFQRGAAQGNPAAMTSLGWAYVQGRGTAVDFDKALQAFQRAGDRDASALCGVGTLYRDGRGVARDDARAAAYFRQSAALLNPCGLEALADFHLSGRGGVERNPQEAVRLLRTVADRGSAWSRLALARAYQQGNGVARDDAEAAYWFLRAAAQGSKDAEKALAELPASAREPARRRLDTELAADRSRQVAATGPGVPKAPVEPVPVVMASRKALVIGNDKYTHVHALENASADARALAKALQSVGYQVTLQIDLDERAMKQALRTFKSQVEGGDEVLIFYAGHGVQLGNANYLLPVDIRGEDEEQVKDEAIQLQRVLEDMSERKAKLTLAVIDACRDNPFTQRSRAIGGRGLAPTTAATGQMVLFSAGAGQQALDKLGSADKNPNSVFTRTLIKEMDKPGLTVDRVLRNVRSQVVELAKSVGHEQVPALYDQVVGDFYFRPR